MSYWRSAALMSSSVGEPVGGGPAGARVARFAWIWAVLSMFATSAGSAPAMSLASASSASAWAACSSGVTRDQPFRARSAAERRSQFVPPLLLCGDDLSYAFPGEAGGLDDLGLPPSTVAVGKLVLV